MTNNGPTPEHRPRVIIIGGGFGGLQAARSLAHAPVDVLLIDRNNYHGFWPLLYQVATAGIEPEQIAAPIRAIIRRMPNIKFMMAVVESVDRQRREVHTDRGVFPYDQLIVAPGSATNFFGLHNVQEQSIELKDLPDALALRNHIIAKFEQAVSEPDPDRRQQLLTFVVVGGGPTGVELSGAIAELIGYVLRKDYPTLDPRAMRIVLVEAADRILLAFPPTLSRRAQRKLETFGVDIRLNTSVVDYVDEALLLKDGTSLATQTLIWAAGIQGAPLGATLTPSLQRGGRVAVTPELHLPDDPQVWVIGDLAYLTGADGKPYPQLATVAMQQGRLVAKNVLRQLQNLPLQRFRYIDKGSMATVGRRSAVARIWGLNWSGPIAWFLWLAVHLFYVIGFRNRVLVLINWAYNYFTYDRGSRALIGGAPLPAVNKPSITGAAEPASLTERDWGA
ncbi:MAG: FAD-dependent oxidoreductase [Chloroflexi bacterium]|nr:MAG: FAD-dependent oxidoreductase [Chloroflexota bacterium]